MSDLIFIPVGSYEQHGPHLPPQTDYLIAEGIAKRLSVTFNGKSIEGIRVGLSEEHQGFVNTKSITQNEFITQIERLLNERNDDEKMVFINAHGGNVSTLNSISILKEKRIKVIDVFSIIKQDLLAFRTSKIGGICHAGEFETSLMLFLHPEIVRMDRLIKEDVVYYPKLDPNYNGEKIKNWKTVDFSESGVLGDPYHATKEKGKLWFNGLLKRFQSIIEEFLS